MKKEEENNNKIIGHVTVLLMSLKSLFIDVMFFLATQKKNLLTALPKDHSPFLHEELTYWAHALDDAL